MGVSWNGGIQQWIVVFVRENPTNMDDLGVFPEMGVSWNGGTPRNHLFTDGIFPNKNHPAIGIPPWLWKPPYILPWSQLMCYHRGLFMNYLSLKIGADWNLWWIIRILRARSSQDTYWPSCMMRCGVFFMAQFIHLRGSNQRSTVMKCYQENYMNYMTHPIQTYPDISREPSIKTSKTGKLC